MLANHPKTQNRRESMENAIDLIIRQKMQIIFRFLSKRRGEVGILVLKFIFMANDQSRVCSIEL